MHQAFVVDDFTVIPTSLPPDTTARRLLVVGDPRSARWTLAEARAITGDADLDQCGFISCVGFSELDDQQVWAIDCFESESSVVIQAFVIAEIDHKRPPTMCVFTSETLKAEAIRAIQKGERSIHLRLSQRVLEMDRTVLSAEQQRLTRSVLEYAKKSPNLRLSDPTAELALSVRSLCQIQSLETGEGFSGAATARALYESAVSGLDSLTEIFMSIQLRFIHEAADAARMDSERRGRLQASADRALQLRDRRLASVAAVLLFPTLWFSLLGANVLPSRILGIQIASDFGLMVAVTGALVMATIGWIAIYAIVRVPKEAGE